MTDRRPQHASSMTHLKSACPIVDWIPDCLNPSETDMYINKEKEMISPLKCNFLRIQEVYDIYEYIICLLIIKSLKW